MKWTSPQCVSAIGSIVAGFTLCYSAYFSSPDNDVPEGVLWVLGQAFMYAGAIFGVKGYVDSKFIKWTKGDPDKSNKHSE